MDKLRSVGAVLAGLVFIVVTHTTMDMVMRAAGVFPPSDVLMTDHWQYVIAFAYRAVLSVPGCYLAAWLAPSRPMAHALTLGIVGIVLTTVGMLVMWGLGPMWYPIALILVSLPAAWLGGMLYMKRSARAAGLA